MPHCKKMKKQVIFCNKKIRNKSASDDKETYGK